MNVLHINTERTWRGGEQQTLYLASGLQRSGISNTMVCQPGSPMEERAAAAGVAVYPLKMRGEWDLVAAWALRGLIKRGRFDIVHMHTSHAHTLGVLGARLAGRAKTIVARRVDFSIYRYPLSISGIKYKIGVDRYIAISHAIREVMIRDKIPAEKISVVHSGIDLSRFEGIQGRSTLRKEFGLKEDTPVVGTVAHFAWHKGIEFLVEAAIAIRKKIPNVKIFLIGEGKLEGRIRDLVDKLDLHETIVFTGFRKDIPQVLDFLDLFVMPSVLEGLCTSILDALSSRLPVIGSEVGGIPEIIEHEKTGLLVPPRDPQALAAAVVRLLEDRALAQRLAQAGRQKVEKQFSIQSMVIGNRKVYEKLLGNPA
ncbi:MAG: glycosyltransferase family 4 protein [Planctomycetes bacterium]|nr:glycosyltransferase family 4 protein [Planctomycetota bacterium]